MRPLAAIALCAFSVCVVACASPSATAQGASGPSVTNPLRVLVKLTQPSDDAELIAKRASASAGVSVRYLASVSPQWHSLSLACQSEAACDAAMQRLRDDSIHFEVVQRDGMSRPLSPPSSSRS